MGSIAVTRKESSVIEFTDPYGAYALIGELGRYYPSFREKCLLQAQVLLDRCYALKLHKCVMYPNPIERLGMAQMVKEIRN